MQDLSFAISISLGLTAVGLVAACIRMFLGPTAADRIVSLDLVTVLMIAITSLLALQLDNSAYLDLGLALALVGFLATVAFARYLETNDQIRPEVTIKPQLKPSSDNDSVVSHEHQS